MPRRLPISHGSALIGLAAVFALAACGEPARVRIDAAGLDSIAYVGRASCASCHADAARAFAGSDHDRAMDVASSASVLGDFDDASFADCGVTTRFFRIGDAYMVRTAGADGQLADFRITHTFGVWPLQQYLVTFPDGRLQALTVAWDVEARRWFSLYGDECVEPDDRLHWTREAMNWNYMCADCHSTGLRRNYQLAHNRYATTFSEIDVSCEACHGPADLHLDWAAGEAVPDTPGPYGLTVDVSRDAPASTEVGTCAPCHSRRRVAFPSYVPGRDYLDHYEPALLEEGLYYADGQIRDEVYVYGSFAQSRMHGRGVRCSDCHDPHSGRPRFEGNALCLQCHEGGEFDTPSHLRHEPGSEAATCVACHMPARTYMVVDPRRDHGFRVPRPDLTASIGIPNACNGCHADRTAQWAADSVRSWYASDRLDLPHFATTFTAARAGQVTAGPELHLIAADTAHAPIIRATALRLLPAGEAEETVRAIREALSDPSPLVRLAAVRSLEDRSSPDESIRLLLPLTTDTARIVRMEAARVLTRFAGDQFVAERAAHAGFWNAVREYREGQFASGEQAAAHLNLAVLHEGFGELREAEEAYRTALSLDSSFVPAHLNLAMLYDRLRLAAGASGEGDALFAASEAALRRAIRLQPDLPDAHYTLGLLLAERERRLEEAADHLETAARLAPDDPRILYNAGLAHQRLGDRARAERLLLAAHRIDPRGEDYLNALSVFYLQGQRWAEARRFTEMLLERFPRNPAYRQRIAYIDRR